MNLYLLVKVLALHIINVSLMTETGNTQKTSDLLSKQYYEFKL